MNYRPRAVGLAARLEQVFGAESALIEGGGGIFDVDGERVYSKHETREFPNEDALIETLRARGGAGS